MTAQWRANPGNRCVDFLPPYPACPAGCGFGGLSLRDLVAVAEHLRDYKRWPDPKLLI